MEATEASSSTISGGQRGQEERNIESPLLPSSDSPEKINVPLASGADSGPSASSTSEIADDYYTSVIGNNYYVFLSFRGPDTRKGFVDHLYHKLVDVGLQHPNFVFRDDENLRFGEPIADNLLAAIKRSKVSIPVISEDYAGSTWCLKELIQIMECREKTGQIVLPVLYKVKTDDVKYMLGKFGDAFRRKHRFDKEFKKKGKAALKKALELRVYDSEKEFSGHEGKLVKELVDIITNERQRDFPPPLPKDLVGIDYHVDGVVNLADTASPETRIIVIHGIGGVGKTTLATTIYIKLCNKFQCYAFLKDIRETIKSKSLEHVQSLLISEITKNHACSVPNSDMGINKIRSSCANKKVLILLDDVDRRDHLDYLIGGCNFESGSRIIITCRDKALLKPEHKEHELTGMNSEDSLLLFSKHAFDTEQPPIELKALSSDIVATTGGLPLALVIIGSFLKRKDESIWTETRDKLMKVPHMGVQQKLMISYNSLGYEEQQMFLDIACFFIGIDKRIANYLWEDLQYCPDSGLKRMIELSLMKIDYDNKLRTHDQLKDLGKAIARPADKKPWDCSRLWDEEAITVQRSKEENRNIEALRLDKNGSIKFMERESFKRMPYLKYLHLSEVDFDGDFEDSLFELRWLEWKICSDSSKVTDVSLEKLLVLDLSGSFISENWGGWSTIKVKKLKVLNLSGCSNLKSIPNLSAFENLEMLILEKCEKLEKIDSSIRDVKRLISLNLGYCGSFKVLPAELGELKEMEELIVDETDIQEIPQCILSLPNLKISAVSCRGLNNGKSTLRKADDTSAFSSSVTSTGSNNYAVFLSFGGLDIRNNFVDNLYNSLVNAGIFVFRHHDELCQGENIGANLHHAIKNSKISIPIISQNYASSKWCLQELAQMVECMKSGEHVILPIFYHVAPADVRYQKEIFGESFLRLSMTYEREAVAKWKEALREVASLNGFVLTTINSYEGELVKLVVTTVESKLK